MLEAKSARREARGRAAAGHRRRDGGADWPPAAVDEGLRDEVRQLVVARNERRMRRGEEPVDVESEVDRRLRELSGS